MHHLKHKNCNEITAFWDEIPFNLVVRYSMVLSMKSPLFCTKTFSTSITNLTVLLDQSHDCSCCVGAEIMAAKTY